MNVHEIYGRHWPWQEKSDLETVNIQILEMWANAQRNGRLAEHWWRPLFNAAKFG